MPDPSERRFVTWKEFGRRLLTFVFSYGNLQLASSWARAGFVLHIPGSDHVKCLFCGLEVRSLHPSHNPMEWHSLLCPLCPFARQMKANRYFDPGILEMDLTNSDATMFSERKRNGSFDKCFHSKVCCKKDALASSGFYLDVDLQDQMHCAFCDVIIPLNDIEDDVKSMHFRKSPGCKHMKGEVCNNIPDIASFLEEDDGVVKASLLGSMSAPLFIEDEARRAGQRPRGADTDTNLVQQAFDLYPRDQVMTALTWIVQNHLKLNKLQDIVKVKNMLNIPDQQEARPTIPPLDIVHLPSLQAVGQAVTDDECTEDVTLEAKVDYKSKYVTEDDVHHVNIFKRLMASQMELNCKICKSRPAVMIFLTCGHLVACEPCSAEQLRCDVCDEMVKGTLNAKAPAAQSIAMRE